MKTVTRLFALGLLLFGAVGSAQAASVLFGPVVAPDAPTELNTTILLPQYNPADHPGSILTGATFTLNAHANGSITLTNNGQTAQTGMGTTTVQLILRDPNNQIITVATPQFTTGNVLLNAQSSQMFSALIGSATATGEGNPLSLYIGTGSVALNLSTVTGLSVFGGGGNFAASQVTQAGATASVVYSFGPDISVSGPSSVPLPSSFYLGFVGISGLLMAQKMRSRGPTL